MQGHFLGNDAADVYFIRGTPKQKEESEGSKEGEKLKASDFNQDVGLIDNNVWLWERSAHEGVNEQTSIYVEYVQTGGTVRPLLRTLNQRVVVTFNCLHPWK